MSEAGYVDVHTHLTHRDFDLDRESLIQSAIAVGMKAIVVNGLEPVSNRQVLQIAARWPVILPALGLYPTEAICERFPEHQRAGSKPFSVSEEIAFIDQCARSGQLAAVGECGLDGYMVGEQTFAEQERVFLALLEVAERWDLPVIIHTRKREVRAMEILAAHGVRRVNFHCYTGKSRRALEGATRHDWFFSIPANAGKNPSFCKLLQELPVDNILTETDAPYLSPQRGDRNIPQNVIITIDLLARLRDWSPVEAKSVVWKNFQRLFGNRQGMLS